MILVSGEKVNLTLNNYILITIVGFFGWIGQLLLSKGFLLEKAGKTVSLSYLQILFSFIIDTFVFKIEFDHYNLIGGLLISSIIIKNIFLS